MLYALVHTRVDIANTKAAEDLQAILFGEGISFIKPTSIGNRYVCVCVYACVHVCMRVHVFMSMRACMHMCEHACVSFRVSVYFNLF